MAGTSGANVHASSPLVRPRMTFSSPATTARNQNRSTSSARCWTSPRQCHPEGSTGRRRSFASSPSRMPRTWRRCPSRTRRSALTSLPGVVSLKFSVTGHPGSANLCGSGRNSPISGTPIAEGVVAEPVRVRRLSDQEGQKLQQIGRRGSTSTVRYRRAMMLLASAGGNRVPVIAKLVRADEDTVRDVIHRFNEVGLADAPMPGNSRRRARADGPGRPWGLRVPRSPGGAQFGEAVQGAHHL